MTLEELEREERRQERIRHIGERHFLQSERLREKSLYQQRRERDEVFRKYGRPMYQY